MLSLSYLSERIRSWAVARNIVDGATQKDQLIKLDSEFGELCGNLNAIELNDEDDSPESFLDAPQLIEKLKDDIGDNYVVLTIIAAQQGAKIEDINIIEGPAFGSAILQLGSAKGKLGDSILKGDGERVMQYIGKCIYFLQRICDDHDLEFNACIAAAYADIKDRRGIMYHGTFIKSTDTRYEACCAEIGVQP